jgi:hypothetical protein
MRHRPLPAAKVGDWVRLAFAFGDRGQSADAMQAKFRRYNRVTDRNKISDRPYRRFL